MLELQNILFLLAIPFFYLNFQIIASDLKVKKIPNKYLLYLIAIIPLYYIFLYISGIDINILLFISQFLITLVVSFILYFYGIWAAGDAKYLLVLSLFIPSIGVVPLITNIAIITLIYLIIYFFWFYLGKCIVHRGYARNLISQISNDLSEKWNIYRSNHKGKIPIIVIKYLAIFFLIFTSIRIFRIYLFNSFLFNTPSLLNIDIQAYYPYLLLVSIILFISFLFLFKHIYQKILNYVSKSFNISPHLVSIVFYSLLTLILTIFITRELSHNTDETLHLLGKIFSIYLGLYIFVQVMIYSYKITFQMNELHYIDNLKLRPGYIFDKNHLQQILGNQKCLGAYDNKDGLLYPNPKKAISKISNPLDEQGVLLIQESISIVNNHYEKHPEKDITPIKEIYVLKTISFAHYIFIGFIVTYLYQNFLLESIIDQIKQYLQNY